MVRNRKSLSQRLVLKARTFAFGSGILIAAMAVTGFAFTACGPAHRAANIITGPNQTGFTAADGKAHTGAGADQELAKLKTELAAGITSPESLPKGDRELAARILAARLESISNAGKKAIRVHLSVRGNDRLTFDFADESIATKKANDGANDVRYKSVVGKTSNGDATKFELSLLCHNNSNTAATPSPCATATLSLQDKYGVGAKAGLVVRYQEAFVFAKSVKPPKHEILKRLLADFKTPKASTLQSFEVAWGPSGFSLDMGDAQICPVGRLVETNDLDEPLKLNCAGVTPFGDLEGRMIGNTTRGELFLEITASISGLFSDSTERVYILVRQQHPTMKPTPNAANPPATPQGAPAPGKTPESPSTTTTPQTDEDDDGEDDPAFPADPSAPKPPETTPTAPPKNGSWLLPLDFNNPITKTWARDRKYPSIEKGVKTWMRDGRIANFAIRYAPNRTLITQKLGESRVPPEFALIMLMESNFLKQDGYPLEGPKGSSAWGPWQMLDDTATGNGLRIFPRLVNRRFIPGNVCDERADLAKSTAAAGRYLRSILDMFPYDPKLVVLGYNQGEFGVQKKISSLKRSQSESRLAAIKEMGLGFWTIRRFNMASAGGIHYVENFVSAYHAALEMAPVTSSKQVEPWRPNPKCK